MPQFNHNTHTLTFALLVAIPLLGGCESTPTALERNFGSSVRNMIELQTAPPADKGFGMDGRKSEAALDMYRKDVAQPNKVDQNIIQIQVGK